MSAADSISWTIPLHVNVSIGESQPLREASRTVTGIPIDEAVLAEGLFGGGDDDVFGDAAPRFSLSALSHAGFSWRTALDAALCSHLAYDSAATVERTAEEWEFDTCRPIAANDTECFVASSADAVVVAFRGTQEAADWLFNINVTTIETDYGYVHRGFYNAFHSVKQQLETALADVDAADKNILLTGHSLGGAAATIAAAEWYYRYPISGVYTFGQPAVGFSFLRSWFEVRYPTSFHRFVNEDDAVPKAPPLFRHVGTLHHFNDGGVSHERAASAAGRVPVAVNDTPTFTPEEYEQFRARLLAERQAAPPAIGDARFPVETREGFLGLPSLADHRIKRYLRQILDQL